MIADDRDLDVLVSAEDLHKSFGDTRAVAGVSLRVRNGEIFGLVGPDGAGKTTTIRLLVGALRADSGRVEICGFDIGTDSETARSRLGYLSQRFSLYEDLTVLENIRFFAEIRGLPSAEWMPRALEVLRFVGLEAFLERRAGQLSGGMKQKLGLATALVSRPRVLLLDEPTTGVDPVTRQDFWQLLLSASALGAGVDAEPTAVLISTPYMDEASRCHRIGFMRAGRIIAEGTPSALRGRLGSRILELRGSPLRLMRHLAAKDADVEAIQAYADRLHARLRSRSGSTVLRRLERRLHDGGVTVKSIRAVPGSLEDVFISLSGDSDG